MSQTTPVPVEINFDCSLRNPTGDVVLNGDTKLLNVYHAEVLITPGESQGSVFYTTLGPLCRHHLKDDGDINLDMLERVVINNAVITINGEIDPDIAERIVSGTTKEGR